jgi:hypothetical protein
VSGDVGSTAVAMVGAAVTALTAGAAGVEGAAAGIAAARSGSAGAASAGTASSTASAGSARALPASTGGNQPAPPQQMPATASGMSLGEGSPTLEGHANQIRSSIGDLMGSNATAGENSEALTIAGQDAGASETQSSGGSPASKGGARSSAPARRGPTVHRYNVGTWGAYHAARIAAGTVARVTRGSRDQGSEES